MPFTIGGDWVPSEENSSESKQEKKANRPVKVREVKRKNQLLTVVLNLSLDKDSLADLARKLKKGCSCGGTVKDGEIEIQGKHLQKVKSLLLKEGIKSQ